VHVIEDGAEEAYAFPLSFAQRRLWFLQQLEPSGAAYNVPFAARLSGRLDASALERALNEIVRRHEILRTTFELLDEEPAQVVSAPKHFTLPLLDLSALTAGEREDHARRLASEEASRPFDLARAPPLRLKLIRLCETEHVLLLTMHHIVSDGWSIGVLTRELSLLYAAYLHGAESPLEELRIQYADFSVWQHETLNEEVLREQLDYWKKALAGAPPVLELPTDRPRAPSPSFEGGHESFVLPRALTESLARLGRREGATLHMTLLAAFQVLLSRYAGQEDVLVGVPVAGRRRREVEPLIGFFVNTLVLRADLRGRPSFREALRRVRDAALGAYAHQDIPFEALVEALRPERLVHHTPLFQVMFNFENTPDEPCELEGLTLGAVETKGETARFDLTLEVIERAGRLHCALRYRSALFEAATVRGMAARLRALLEAVVADANLPVARLSLSSEEERRRALFEWSGVRRQYPTGHCLHRLFEEAAARTPDATALVSGGRRLTYAELDREANRLAHHLRRRGLRAEETAAILLERSARYVVAMLAVLKAGAAYVPLDTSHPSSRLGLIMDDARVKLLITEPAWRHVGPPSSGVVVCLEEQRRQIETCDGQNPRGGATAENLAYVIYTSGSTGKPKGVAVEHRQLANYLHAINERLRLEPGDSYAVVSTLAADLGYTMLWPALCGGGLLHVLSPELCADAEALGEYFRAHRIDCLKIVPSHLEALLGAAPRVPPLPRKRLVLGGERAHRGLLEELRRLRPPCVIHNHYGPTETTVGVLTAPIGEADAEEARAGVKLGRPLGNTTAFVLDAGMQPAPAGISGELYIGGANVARGYAHAAAATAARFIPDPYSGEPGARLYRTGDLARYSRDGQIEFLGRADDQFKVRGFRVELGDIESALREHAAVREAAVLAREVAGGGRRLEAYVVTQAPLSVAEVREFLRNRLPEPMIPAAFVFAERLPLNANGKLDRRALLAAPPPATVDDVFIAPRDTLESQLCRVWEEVLGVQPVGVRSNFFDLGGHSLLAVRLAARVEQVTGRKLPLSALFGAPTAETLSALLRNAPEAQTPSPLVAIQPRGSRRPFFCVHAAGGSVFPYVGLAQRLGVERPFYGLQARGADDMAEPATSVEEMAADYLVAIRAAQKEGPYLLGGWSLGGSIAFEMARQLRARGVAASLIMLDAVAPGFSPAGEDDDDLAILFGFALQLGLSAEDAAALPEGFSSLGREEQLALVFERAKQSPALPRGVDFKQLRRLMRVYRSNLHAARSYRPAPLPLRLTLLRAESTHGDSHADSDPTLGWQSLTTEPVELRIAPGDHFTMLRDPHVASLALLIAEACATGDHPGFTQTSL
jgi:amino acid adenylation domain-containing protein